MLRRSATAWKNSAPQATLPLLFTALIYSLAPTVADTQALEFRYGVSQLSYLPVVPAHYWLERDLSEPTMAPPTQSGPYRLTGVSQDRYLIYERVPDYWARDLPVNRGKFNFDTIRYERYLDATVAREALRAGMLDVWTETDSRHWLASYDVPARGAGALVLGRLRSGDLSGARYRLAMNTRRQPFDDLRVREALFHALDFEWQIRVLHGGELTRANSFFAGSMFASSGLPVPAGCQGGHPHRLLGQVRSARPAGGDVYSGVPGRLVVRRGQGSANKMTGSSIGPIFSGICRDEDMCLSSEVRLWWDKCVVW